jgi:cytochrome c peroxidase
LSKDSFNYLIALLILVIFGVGNAVARPNDKILLSAEEVRRVLSHGPWPMPTLADAGNAHSQNIDAQRLGKTLFFDKRLSSNGAVSCATCHDPRKAFSDGLPVSKSIATAEPLTRNAPSLFNAVHERWYGWDGASDSIWSQSLRPLLDSREMGVSAVSLRHLVARDFLISKVYKKVFPDPRLATDDVIGVNVAKLIAAYVGTLASGKTPFDKFRDSLAKGDFDRAARYPQAAQRGVQIFVGKGQCSTCHVGPMFSNGEFADTGVAFFTRPGVVDEGRYGGISILRKSPYNLLSTFSSASTAEREKTLYVDAQHRNFGEFKVPSLRNVAQTGPYMHNGSLPSLAAVVAHYSELSIDRLHADGDQILKPLHLSGQEKRDLIAFLKSLSVKR